MKKRILAGSVAMSLAMMMAGSMVFAEEADVITPDGDYTIALITMDSTDQYWVMMNDGAQAEAEKDGVTVEFMSPETNDESLQIEYVNNAVARGCDAIMIGATGPDSIVGALRDAVDAGVKIIYVDSPANYDGAEVTYATDNLAAGVTAGEQMIAELESRGITSGDIGICNVNASTKTCVDREEGFRQAFEGTEYNLLETQYCDGDASKAQNISENFVTQQVVGIYGTNEAAATGIGNAIKASDESNIVGVGFDESSTIDSLIEDGYLSFTIAQNPQLMGAMGVRAAIRSLNGEDLGKESVAIDVTIVTAETLAE